METRQLLNEGIDLHLHSDQSDGQNSVKEIINLAFAQEHLRVIVLTDHNHFSLTNKYIVGSKGHFLDVLPGCEFSTTFTFSSGKKEEIHVIGIFPENVNPKAFADLFAPIAEGKQKYVEAILSNLQHLGIHLNLQKVMKEKKSTGYIGRFHIAEAMVKLGYGHNVDEIMDNYIGNFSEHYLPTTDYISYAPFQTVIERILNQSGFPILAHAYSYHKLDANEVIELIESFRAISGSTGGLEVYYQHYSRAQQNSLRKLAETYNLVPSVASDRHRTDQPFANYGGYSFYKEMLTRLTDRRKDD